MAVGFVTDDTEMFVRLCLFGHAKIFRFCRSKCHKNFKMKRNPRKVKWTKAYRKLHGKELTQDATFEFERRRNRPERYNREVVEQTLKAMKKIDEVRVQREAKFWESRMKGKKAKERTEAAKELEQNIHLVKAPGVMKSEPGFSLPKLAEKTKVKVSTSSKVEMQE